MATTYDFLKNAWQKKKLQSSALAPLLITAVLLTIPLPYIINSISVIAFVAFIAANAKKQSAGITLSLLLPAFLYLLMALSIFWSINVPETVKALSKELPLLVLPLCFLFYKPDRPTKNSIIKGFSYGMILYGIYFLARALIRYFFSGSTEVFFYHELVTKDVNAIYISAMFSVAFFYFLSVKQKKVLDYSGLLLSLMLIILLSSKNIIIINIIIISVYYMFFAGYPKNLKIASAVIAAAFVTGAIYFSKVGERIVAEYQPSKNRAERSINGINNLTVYEAVTLPEFQPNDYFNGTAFRAYQLRIFYELLQEDNILFTGYGLNASLNKINEKGVEYNLYLGEGGQQGYHTLNFHNQYIEIFADTGIIGFLLFVFIQIFNLKIALKTKDFPHIAFAILMISLFLTESFLWRQRGVVFFTMLYCLYISSPAKPYSKNTV